MKKILVAGVAINPNKHYTLIGLKKIFGAQKIKEDCCYITLSHSDWDNDLLLYIQSKIDKKYMVTEAN